jgi:hypothetical protein
MTVRVAVKTWDAREVCALIFGLCMIDPSRVRRVGILCRYAAQKAGLPALRQVHRIADVRSAESWCSIALCARRLLELFWDRWDLW